MNSELTTEDRLRLERARKAWKEERKLKKERKNKAKKPDFLLSTARKIEGIEPHYFTVGLVLGLGLGSMLLLAYLGV